MSTFSDVPGHFNFRELDGEILEFWRRERIFERSLEAAADQPLYVFYEGPPTANGIPHNGHVLTRVLKDVILRHRAMAGYRVPRKAGWDTHGLPVEIEVEKELGIHGKAAIEEFGVADFNRRCIESVFKYTRLWEQLTERIGFWLDMEEGYATFHQYYVESVWWALSELYRKGLLYQGHKVLWWWPQGGTALSAAEVGDGYREVDDPSITVRFRDADGGPTFLAWTTTPWTLISNCALAVNADIEYVEVEHQVEGADAAERFVLAADLADKVLGEGNYTVQARFKGADLVGRRYQPIFRYAEPEGGDAWRVIAADFVTTEAGTGVVHIAPAFGEDDYRACQQAGIGMLQLVEPNGTFSASVTPWAGQMAKPADKQIIAWLREQGVLLKAETYRHDYPFCPRAKDDPLIQYARPAWYVRTTEFKDRMLANNEQIEWVPEHIQQGRFGDFLRNNVDWAVSRERFWGTPLPIWSCDACEEQFVASSVASIEERNPHAFDEFEAARARDPDLPPDLKVHKPWIDRVTMPCSACGGTMHRVPEVLDCWFDAGSMPFAQWGYPHRNREAFEANWPADYIVEAIDQTRGWFYVLLAISTGLFDEETCRRMGLSQPGGAHPYKSCVVLGHVTDPDGKKESKSIGNYVSPDVVLLGRYSLLVSELPNNGPSPKKGEIWLAQSQVKSLDLGSKERVRLTADEAGEGAALSARVVFPRKLKAKQLGRALRKSVVLHPEDRAALGLSVGDQVWIHMPFDPPGSDAFRWLFLASSPPWNNTRNSLRAIREGQADFLLRLRNVYSFFVIYANIDGFDPGAAHRGARGVDRHSLAGSPGLRAVSERSLMDRWILSELALATRGAGQGLDQLRAYDAAQYLRNFADSLSNWWLRRSRDRFWAAGMSQDKYDAYWTLWECLTTLARLAAPFTPFFAEELWQNLVCRPFDGGGQAPSVHMSRYPEADASEVDDLLSRQMGAVREIARLGLAARNGAQIKVRQPLAAVEVVLSDPALRGPVEQLSSLIADELNVHAVQFVDDARDYVTFRVQPRFRVVGRKYGRQVPQIKKALAAMDGLAARTALDGGSLPVELADGSTLELTGEDVEVRLDAREGYSAQVGAAAVVVLHTEITDALARECIAREVVNRIQTVRKELDLPYQARIQVELAGAAEALAAVEEHRQRICADTLASALHTTPAELAEAEEREVTVEGHALTLRLARA